MDAIYAGQRHIYDVTRKYYLLGRDQLIGELAARPGARVLEVGCGTGRNLLLVARRWPGAMLFGLDVSREMLKSAAATLNAGSRGARAQLGLGDAAAFDPQSLFGEAAFDRIMFSYTLSMIPDWQGALRQGLDLLAPGGSLHIVDFGDQARLPGGFRRLLRAWLARFDVTPRDAMPAWLADECAARGLECEIAETYRSYAMSARVRRPT